VWIKNKRRMKDLIRHSIVQLCGRNMVSEHLPDAGGSERSSDDSAASKNSRGASEAGSPSAGGSTV
jgi:hypothetical protein